MGDSRSSQRQYEGWYEMTCSLVDSYSPTLKEETANTYETSVLMYKDTQSHSPEGSKRIGLLRRPVCSSVPPSFHCVDSTQKIGTVTFH
jgi:hypothetical protein